VSVEEAPEVSVVIPIRNEIAHIGETLDAARRQDFEGSVEFLLVDGESDDGTREVLAEVAAADPRFRVLDNPARRTPNALNTGLRAARGRYLVRMDAHTLYPADYISQGVERLRRGGVDWVTGPALPAGKGEGSQTVAQALSTWLGVGAATFRKDVGDEVVVDTGFAGVMERRFLERLGGWDDAWPINQDAELAARVREHGGTIVCIPQMAADYVPRDTLKGLARQYWRYGSCPPASLSRPWCRPGPASRWRARSPAWAWRATH
jgi:glycosyltransferase involved in cell wall biosynthesis